MIPLTRLNRQPFWLNSDLVKFLETTPDSVITLVSGEKIVVLEKAEVIVERLLDLRQRLLKGLMLCGVPSPQTVSDRGQSPPAGGREETESTSGEGPARG